MRAKLSIFGLVIVFLSGCAHNPQDAMYQRKPAFYSYVVGDVESDAVEHEHASQVYVTPASCQKIITALLAYKELGEDFRYATKLYVTKRQRKVHDVVIAFVGDPTLVSEDIVALLKPLKGKVVSGRIIVDATLYKLPEHSRNLMIDDIGAAYAQPVSSVNLDKNLIEVRLAPGKDHRVSHLSNSCGYQMDSEVVLTPGQSPAVKLRWIGDVIRAQGRCDPRDTFDLKISPENQDVYILHKMRAILKVLKIAANVTVVRDKTHLPRHAVLLNTVQSKPLKDMLPPALKISDNLVFDSLYLTMLHTQKGFEPGDWSEGSKIIKERIMTHFGIEMSGATIVDGSGGSRYNSIQPATIFALLKQGFANKAFVNALPAPGDSLSTLKARGRLAPSIRAKTGSMSGISCLCGYSLGSRRNKAFILIANQFAPPASEMHGIMDAYVNACVAD